MEFKRGASVLDGALDLQAIANNSFVRHETLNVSWCEAGNLLDIEVRER